MLDETSDPKDKSQQVPDLTDADDLDLNKYLSAKVQIPKDGHTFANGRVIRRARDSGGQLVGKSHNNPIFDTSVYEVEFEDGSVEKYNANIIAEHICAQLDDDGYTRMLMDEIIDHRSDKTAIKQSNGFVRDPMEHPNLRSPLEAGNCVSDGKTTQLSGFP